MKAEVLNYRLMFLFSSHTQMPSVYSKNKRTDLLFYGDRLLSILANKFHTIHKYISWFGNKCNKIYKCNL